MDDRAAHKIEKHLARIAASAERIADALEAANEREAEWRKLMGRLTPELPPQPQPEPVNPLEAARAADQFVKPPEWMKG